MWDHPTRTLFSPESFLYDDWVLAFIMSCSVPGLGLLLFEIKHNYPPPPPKAQAPMTRDLPFRTLITQNTAQKQLGESLAALWHREASVRRDLSARLSKSESAQCNWISSDHSEETVWTFLSLFLSRVCKGRQKGTPGARLKLSCQTLSARHLLARRVEVSSSQICLRCNSPTTPLRFNNIRSWKVFAATVQMLPLISSTRPNDGIWTETRQRERNRVHETHVAERLWSWTVLTAQHVCMMSPSVGSDMKADQIQLALPPERILLIRISSGAGNTQHLFA